jgi:hypothetical protein
MAFQIFEIEDEEVLNRAIVTSSAIVLLTCAIILLLFIYLKIPAVFAAALSIIIFVLGSASCWKSYAMSQTLFLLSLLAIEFVLLHYFDFLFWIFIILDLAVIIAFLRSWTPKAEE